MNEHLSPRENAILSVEMDELNPNHPGPRTHADRPPWLERASDLLREGDPGPTEMLVEKVAVDQALIATVGRWKTTKTYFNLDFGISVVTGLPLLGSFAVPRPGPVVVILEESGRKALWRRLDALCRGRAIDRGALENLHTAANRRVRLDDPKWQNELVDVGKALLPRLFIFDPIARMKAPGLDESAQKEFAKLIEFLRDLRDETGAAINWTHHTGHTGGHMRGTSDLETVWETRLGFARDDNTVTVTPEHREEENGEPISYRLNWDGDTRTMRLTLVGRKDTLELVCEHLAEHRNEHLEDIARALEIRTSDVRRALKLGATLGTTHAGPSGRRDKRGRPIRDKVWNLASQDGLWPVPTNGTTQDEPDSGHRGSVARPAPLGADAGRATTDDPDDAYLDDLAADVLERERTSGAG
jgi:hypothetical protein